MLSSSSLFLKAVLEAAIISSVITKSGGHRDASYYVSRWASTNSQAQTKLSPQFQQIPTPVRPIRLKEEAGVEGAWPDTQILPPQTGTVGLGGNNTTLPYANTDVTSLDREGRCKFVGF